MHRPVFAALVAGAVTIAAATPAAAINCYMIVDRNDNVVYRGTMAPIDLSEKGAAERDALRQRGQQLIAMDVDRCLGIEYFTGAAGSPTLTVDQIVSGIQPMRGQSPGGNVPASSGGAVIAPSGATPAARPPAPAPRASGMSGSGTRSSY